MIDDEKQLHIRIPKDIYMKLKVKCAYEEVSIQDYLLGLIRDALSGNTGEKPSLLIVDDEQIVRDSLADSLRDSHDVEAVGSAEEALELVAKRDFDIVVTDVRLPGKTGVELVREIRELKPYVTSIVMTAYPSVQLAVEAMKQGAVDYLVKPVGASDLARVFETYKSGMHVRGAAAAPADP